MQAWVGTPLGAVAGRPRAETPGPRGHPDTSTHTPPDGRPGTRANSRRRPDTLRQGHTDPAAHRHSGALLPAATRPPRGSAPAAASPVTFMSLTMAWKSPPRAPHSFSAVSMLGPGGGRAQAVLRGPTDPGEPGRGGRSLRGRARPVASEPGSEASRATIQGRGPPQGGAGHVTAGLAAARGARRGQLAAQPRRGD